MSMAEAPPRVFLDACVLYPSVVRRLLLEAGDADLITPLWSPRVLTEWRIAVAGKGGDAAMVDAIQARMAARWPDAGTLPDPAIEAEITLPDPADAHVLAAAVAGRAETLVTFNLRDFPERRCARYRVAPRHPDSLLWALWSDSAAMAGIVAAVMADTDRQEMSVRNRLKRARLPRLAKAVQTSGG